jgi:hypothetical protein
MREPVEFRLTNKWEIPRERHVVAAVLYHLPGWTAWWPSWRRLDFEGNVRSVTIGSAVQCTLKGALPYKLMFELTVKEHAPDEYTSYVVTGGLKGTGSLTLRATGDDKTTVTFDWNVTPIARTLEMASRWEFLRVLVEANHDQVMEEGERGLMNRLGC